MQPKGHRCIEMLIRACTDWGYLLFGEKCNGKTSLCCSRVINKKVKDIFPYFGWNVVRGASQPQRVPELRVPFERTNCSNSVRCRGNSLKFSCCIPEYCQIQGFFWSFLWNLQNYMEQWYPFAAMYSLASVQEHSSAWNLPQHVGTPLQERNMS